MKKKTKYYAVINTKWKEDGWTDLFYTPMLGIRTREMIFGLSVFNSKKEARKFKNLSINKVNWIVEVVIKIKE